MVHSKRYNPDKVCIHKFDSIDAESACHTLGFVNGGIFGWVSNTEFPWPEIPTLTGVNCESNSTNFSMCDNSGLGHCGSHRHNVFLTCFESGETYLACIVTL